jgi:hypothetical protein
VAALAPSVLRRARDGDRAARRAVREAQQALASLAGRTARALHLRPPVTLSWAGGLLGHAPFRAGVWRHLRGQGLRIRPVRPRAPAASPAAWRAIFPAKSLSR